jgi:nucleotide-binding universal stress UspA family protein
MRNILVPVDFSDDSRQAADFAVYLAKQLNTRVVFLHTYHPLPYSPEMAAFVSKQEMDRLLAVARRQLQKWTARYFKSYPNRCALRVETDTAAEEIIHMAQEFEAMMIIMGRRGMSQVERLLLGSVSTRVVKKAKCPVLLVPEDWRGGRLRHIVFATDYRQGDIAKAQFLAEIAEAFDAEVTAVHAHAREYKDFYETHLMAAYRVNLLNRVHYDKLKFEIVSSHRGAEYAVHEYVANHKVDLLAVARSKDRFFHRVLLPGFTKQALLHMDIPLLVLPNAGHLLTFPDLRRRQPTKK